MQCEWTCNVRPLSGEITLSKSVNNYANIAGELVWPCLKPIEIRISSMSYAICNCFIHRSKYFQIFTIDSNVKQFVPKCISINWAERLLRSTKTHGKRTFTFIKCYISEFKAINVIVVLRLFLNPNCASVSMLFSSHHLFTLLFKTLTNRK